MNQSRPGKAFWLAAALARRPRDLPQYLRLGPAHMGSTLDLGLPWFSFAAIEFLEQRLTGSETVYEYGGGGSTVFFARRAARVVTVENDEEWVAALRAHLASTGLHNVEVVAAVGSFDDPAGFGGSAFARALPEEPADVILIDSWDGLPPYPFRPELFPRAEERVRPGGLIVVDDSWRYQQLRTRSHAKQIVTRWGVGPARRTATMTDFYLY